MTVKRTSREGKDLDEIVQGIPIREKIFIGGDRNGMKELVVMGLIVYVEDFVLRKEMN